MSIAYIAIGSNLGDSHTTVQNALQEIQHSSGITLLATSSFYRSKPLGPQDQNDFLNAVIKVETKLFPLELLKQLQAIEIKFGRIRKKERFGPRTLDLDILLFDEACLKTEILTLPHYDLHRREFVLYPLFEIEPTLNLPKHGSLKTLIMSVSKNGLEKWIKK